MPGELLHVYCLKTRDGSKHQQLIIFCWDPFPKAFSIDLWPSPLPFSNVHLSKETNTCELDLMSEYLLQSMLFLGTSKRSLGSKQNIKDDSTTPHITFISKESSDNFRSHVADSSNKIRTSYFRFVNFTCSTKIKQSYFNLILVHKILNCVIKHYILQFQVSVNYFDLVQVIQTSQQLPHDSFDYFLIIYVP